MHIIVLFAVITVSFVGSFFASPARSQSCIDFAAYVAEVGSYDASGVAQAIVPHAPYAFVAMGSALEVIDLSNPTEPEYVTRLDDPGSHSMYWAVLLSGSRLAMGGRWGAHIIDVSNPSTPTLSSSFDTPGYSRDICVDGQFAYVADDSMSLVIVDLDGAQGPEVVSLTNTPSWWEYANAIAFSNGHVYIAGSDGFHIFDVSDPYAPVLVYSNPSLRSIHVRIHNNIAYVLSGSLQTYDISIPDTPVLLGSVGMGRTSNFHLDGDRIYYCAEDLWGNHVYTIDVSNPVNPGIVDKVRVLGDAKDVAVIEPFAYVLNPDGIAVLDLRISTEPQAFVSQLQSVASHSVMKHVGDFIYFPVDVAGIEIVDVSDPTSPYQRSVLDLPGNCWDLDVVGNYALVASGFGGLRVVDVRNPDIPLDRGFWGSVTNFIRAVAATETHAFVGTYTSHIYSIDYTDPTNPTLASLLALPADVYAVIRYGDVLFVATFDGMWNLVDISDPTAMSLITQYPHSFKFLGIEGAIAYTQEGTSFVIRDISDPTNPVILGSCNAPTGMSDEESQCLGVAGGVAYIGGSSGYMAIDVSDPGAPYVLGRTDEQNSGGMTSIAGNYVVLSTSYGLRVGLLDCTSTPVGVVSGEMPSLELQVEVFPNPFNASTTFSYELAAQSHVQLRVFDLHGRCVRTVVDALRTLGDYSDIWDGRDDIGTELPSGVYFANIKAGKRYGSQKLVLLK